MQKSWREDGDKLTFIVCLAPDGVRECGDVGKVKGVCWDGEQRMIGDVNLFLVHEEQEKELAEGSSEAGVVVVVGEVEIMIAREDLQGRGYGKATLRTFLWYVIKMRDQMLREYYLGERARQERTPSGAKLRYLRVKIDQENRRSIALFESVGFKTTSKAVSYFGEVELRLRLPEGDVQSLTSRTQASVSAPLLLEYDLG